MNQKRKMLIMILLLLSIVAVTVGMTYAIFNYVKEGTTDNTITTQSIEFLYTEVDKVGAGIAIEEAYPVSDDVGKAQTGSGKVFNFKVTSKITDEINIPYTVTARKKQSDNALSDEAVRIYLTEVNGTTEKQLLLDNYNALNDYKNRPDGTTEKVIYEGLVSAGTKNYEKNFRLRMWIDSDIKFSPIENEDGSITYPYNDKEFTLNVNVYANAKVVTDAEVDMANTTKIETITVNDPNVQAEAASEEEEYDYIANVDNNVSNVSLEIETTNPEATVEVTKIEDTTALNTKVQRLSQTVTFALEEGDNLFNIKILSANKQVENDYILNIFRTYSCTLEIGETWTFDYIGNSEEFIVPCTGTYKLEVYGGKGQNISGNTYGTGGNGGYSSGYISLNASENLFVSCGGANGTTYNGGGTVGSLSTSVGNGGGATHIAKGTTNRGELKNYANYKEEILIVAGGGGAGTEYGAIGGNGGAGGGTTGSDGATRYNAFASGGTQVGGGTFTGEGTGAVGEDGSFGQGGLYGGGGGYYGGAGCNVGGGGGGSGYIGGVIDGTTENGINSGSGYAQITLVSIGN